jgi:very-short-patch-repair endonuclease
VVDFYCAERHLVVELDGGQHAETDVAARDAERTAVLTSRGLRVLRFWNHEVLGDIEGVLGALWLALRGPGTEL